MSQRRRPLHGGRTPTGEWKRRRARRWGHQLRAGGAIARVAAKRLAQRGHALKLVEKRRQRGVLDEHMRMMRRAKLIKREERGGARRLPLRSAAERAAAIRYALFGPSEENRAPDVCSRFGCRCRGTRPGHFPRRPAPGA